MTQEEILNEAYSRLPNAATYDGTEYSVMFNEDKVSSARMIIDQHEILNFNPNLPMVVIFNKIKSGDGYQWKIQNNDFSFLDAIDNDDE